MTKGTVLDCRKVKAGVPITARSLANVDSLCFCTAESKKVPQAQEPRAWDISYKSLANA